ncbi:MAG: UPF0182 family protein [Deltaproteobacteria bacterium]|nr:UPF0182 family protein [Deltaproteobacteria bacterium]
MKLKKKFVLIAVVIVAAAVMLTLFMEYYGDWLWFENLGFGQVFTTILWAKFLAFAVFFCIFGIFAGANIVIARRWGKATRTIRPVISEVPHSVLDIIFHEAYSSYVWALIVLSFSVLLGYSASKSWMTFLQFLHRTPFGVSDPIYHRDLGFYLFTLPLYYFFQGWYLSTIFLVAIGVGLSYYLDQAIGVRENRLYIYPRVKSHLGALGGLFSLGIAWTYWLKLYGLMYSSSGVAYGASYSDVHAKIPAYWVLLILALVMALLLFLMPVLKKWRWVLYTVGVYVLVVIGFSWIYPRIIEQYVVKPNELVKETQYIKNNIKLSRLGFGLDKAQEKPFTVNPGMTYKDIQKNEPTIHNIRLWDHRPLIQTYKQLQEIRLYYDFKTVNVDRYQLGNKYTEVALAARELPASLLPSQAKTWVNMHLVYTHGYGLVMSPVNEVTGDGLPNLVIKDIPPQSSSSTEVTRPEIYYGEETEGFSIVHTTTKEFDYPKGNQNEYASYEGRGGVQISSFFRRLVYSWNFLDPNVLFSSYITSDSRIMFHRIITNRDYTIAPFLSYDSEPYVVVGEDGHLYWIHDAYTTSNMFPYSQPFPQTGNRTRSPNYIRNSVKVVIDAYNGDVSYYVIDSSDPLVQTYSKIFPSLFKPIKDMPSFLKRHIRYPMDLFTIQVQMYATYHMTDPQVFYNQEDLWSIPQEIYKNTQQSILPYYIIMRLPDTASEEFILMLPLTPSGKDNMVAWMCARCDGDSYGELLIYMLSKEKLIYGPMQIEARINQKPDISSELTLWGQQGSKVIRGNLLIIPIEHSFIYVEPVYLQSEQGEMPQLKRVIAVHGNELEMRRDLDDALRAVFSVAGVPEEQTAKALTQLPTGQVPAMAQQALDHYNKALNYLKQGNWGKYGEELSQMKQILENMAGEK